MNTGATAVKTGRKHRLGPHGGQRNRSNRRFLLQCTVTRETSSWIDSPPLISNTHTVTSTSNVSVKRALHIGGRNRKYEQVSPKS
jgi:hypothetical protein